MYMYVGDYASIYKWLFLVCLQAFLCCQYISISENFMFTLFFFAIAFAIKHLFMCTCIQKQWAVMYIYIHIICHLECMCTYDSVASLVSMYQKAHPCEKWNCDNFCGLSLKSYDWWKRRKGCIICTWLNKRLELREYVASQYTSEVDLSE